MDIQTLGTERKKVDSNQLAVGGTAVISSGVGAVFAWMLLKWLLNHQSRQTEIQIELQRETLSKLDRLIELNEHRGEL